MPTLLTETKTLILADLNNAIQINSAAAFANCLEERLKNFQKIVYERGYNAERTF